MVMEKNEKNMCGVIRVAIGFRAGYHHVKLNEVEQKYMTKKFFTENTLQNLKKYIQYSVGYTERILAL